MPAPQNMKATLEWGAGASSMVMTNGIMYGQNESANVPNADAKMSATMVNGQWSLRRRMLTTSTAAATAPIAGKTNRYGRSIHRFMMGMCSVSAYAKTITRNTS